MKPIQAVAGVVMTLSLACAAESGGGIAAEETAPEPAPDSALEAAPTKKATPEDFQSTKSILRRSAAVVQVVADRIAYAFDQHTGPRTVVTFTVSDVLAGSYEKATLELRLFGGPLPDGTTVSTSDEVKYVEGASYVLFLSNEPWFFEPTVGEPLRVDEIDGQQVLSDTHGRALRSLSPRGMSFGAELVAEDAAPPAPGARDENAKATVGALSESPAAVRPLAVAEALDVATFSRLLEEAIEAEGVMPNGQFGPAPRQRDDWSKTPAATALVTESATPQ